MITGFSEQIAEALGHGMDAAPEVHFTGRGALPSYFDVAGLAADSIAAAARELGALMGARQVQVDRRLAQFWFGMTLRPEGWTLPNPWDDIAGDYRARDGWIKLHTNAPHHRAAALSVLDCAPNKTAVAQTIAGWRAEDLETAIVAASGCAAALQSRAAWATHPQGRAVAREPLISWQDTAEATKRVPQTLDGLRVLDLTRVLAGPVATRLLAGFGANVLRIDPPDWHEPGVEPEVTVGKRRAGLDLRKMADRSVFEGLMRDADVVVHGYRPDALDRMGYGAHARRALNPDLIDVSLCAYGWTGPWAGRRGFDSLIQMSSGIAAEGLARGDMDVPSPLPVQALDHATGYLMAAAVLRALRVKGATGAVRSARLSLARTAALLASGRVQSPEDTLDPETPADLDPTPERTPWGPAQRLRFPILVDDMPPNWRTPAGQLRVDPAQWTRMV
ncbi:CoA transferase [Tateyamaria sp. SN3-11]|uniref:CoA transferase n=1 Tax=Tateyamaria sp. SN3-11 TaxID=3092147 RepID=UPI0039EB364A